MPLPNISFRVREYIRARLNGTDQLSGSSFNTNMAVAASAYGVAPFTLNEFGNPPSLFLGRYDLATLVKADKVSVEWLPLAVLSVAKDDLVLSVNVHSSHTLRVTPTEYSGPIFMSLDFYIQQVAPPVDGEAMFHALEEALYATFNIQEAYSLIPAGATYNNELVVQQGNMEWDGNRWSQHIPCAMVFYWFVV